MKVTLRELKANPFRDMGNYPINRGKVESLKSSIEQTEFWDNILARHGSTGIEIAYGHHRLTALRELYNDDHVIDIPVKDLDDSTMIRIMANENMEQWGVSAAIITETVKATRDFLNSELSKIDRWDTSSKLLRGVFESVKSFDTVKGQGVGKETILKFLGGNWSLGMISAALSQLKAVKDGDLDEVVVKLIEHPSTLSNFMTAAKGMPLDKQRQTAKEIKDLDIGKRDVGKYVNAMNELDKKSKKYGITDDQKATIKNTLMSEIINSPERRAIDTGDVIVAIQEIAVKKEDAKAKQEIQQFDKYLIDLSSRSNDLKAEIDKLNVAKNAIQDYSYHQFENRLSLKLSLTDLSKVIINLLKNLEK